MVPEAPYGYTFDFVFCSAEWPTFGRHLVQRHVLRLPGRPDARRPERRTRPSTPYSGNVTFIPDPNDPTKGLPVTITALDRYFDGPGYTYAEPQLWGTGFETHACSDWFTAKGGVQPGAEITVGFFLADMSDANFATVALLDDVPLGLRGLRAERGRRLRIKPQ